MIKRLEAGNSATNLPSILADTLFLRETITEDERKEMI